MIAQYVEEKTKQWNTGLLPGIGGGSRCMCRFLLYEVHNNNYNNSVSARTTNINRRHKERTIKNKKQRNQNIRWGFNLE